MDALALIAREPAAAALFLDVDGVLAPIVDRPEAARVPDETRAELERLAGRYGLVAAVTGRPSDVAREIVGVETLRYAGEHGLELDPAASAWAEPIHAFAAATAWPETELKPLSAAFHFRTAADPGAAREQLEAIAAAAGELGLRTRFGRLVLEVLPPVDASKGTAVRALLAETGLRRALYAGDDTTDLNGFEALDGLDVAVRIAVASNEGPAAADQPSRPRRRVTGSVARAAARALELQPLAQLTRLAPRDVELGLTGVGQLQAKPVRGGAADGSDLRQVDEVRPVHTREARAEPLLELAERCGAEVGAVVGVDAAVVTVSLDVVDLADVEQLGSAGRDDRDLLDRQRALARALAQPFDDTRQPIRIDGFQAGSRTPRPRTPRPRTPRAPSRRRLPADRPARARAEQPRVR